MDVNSRIREAANDVAITVDRSVGSEGAPDGALYEQALEVARREANAVWDEELNEAQREVAALLAVTFWMQRVAAYMAFDPELEIFFATPPE